MGKIVSLFIKHPKLAMDLSIPLICLIAGLSLGIILYPDRLTLSILIFFLSVLIVSFVIYYCQGKAKKFIEMINITTGPSLEYYCPACDERLKVRYTDVITPGDLICPKDNIPLKTYDPVEDG